MPMVVNLLYPCESLMLDNKSKSDTLPIIELNNDDIDIGHEAKIGRISDEAIFYLMSRRN